MGIKRRLASLYFPDFRVKAHVRNKLDATMGYILMYHEVLPESASVPAWTVVKENEFRWQIEFLQKHYDLVSLDCVKARVIGEQTGNRPFVAITFDDGYSGNLSTVLPIMQTLKAPFAVYVATQAIEDGTIYWYDRIINLLKSSEDIIYKTNKRGSSEIFKIPAVASDNRRWLSVQNLLTWLKSLTELERQEEVARIVNIHPEFYYPDLRMLTPYELRELASDPLVTVGSHTHAHELLDQLPDDEITKSVTTANHFLEKWTGRRPNHFSYPNGNVDERVRKLIEKFGFRTAVTTESRLCSNRDNLLAMPRLGIGRFDSASHFKAKLAGFL